MCTGEATKRQPTLVLLFANIHVIASRVRQNHEAHSHCTGSVASLGLHIHTCCCKVSYICPHTLNMSLESGLPRPDYYQTF